MSSELVEFMTNVLLATIADVHLAGLTTDEPNKVLTVALISTQPHPYCPCCQTPAQRVHSTYTRHLADLPWAQWAVQLQLRVRKCFCPNPDCRRTIFSERVLPLAAPWARRTVRLANVQQQGLKQTLMLLANCFTGNEEQKRYTDSAHSDRHLLEVPNVTQTGHPL